MSITYKDAGVDIDAGARLIDAIRPIVNAVRRPEVLGHLGGFAGLCGLPVGYRDPVLVSGTDGVGTKLTTAFATHRHTTIGIDPVAMAGNEMPRPAANDSMSMRHPCPTPDTPPITASSSGTTTSTPMVGQL